MAIFTCDLCGEQSEARSSRQRFCSSECRDRDRSADCAGCGKRVSRSRTSAKIQYCRDCRAKGEALTHGASGYDRRKCRCATCREGKRLAIAKYAAKVKAEHGVVPSALYKRRKPRKACGWCGENHPLEDQVTRRSHAQWLRHYRPSHSQELVTFEPAPVVTREPEPPRRPMFISGPCGWCGDQFTAATWTGTARFCSSECRKSLSVSRYRQRGDVFRVSPARRKRLYERDGHTCQICFQPTSATWSADDPWSPTLDHVEPQASAPDPDHSDENLRLAHAICNSYRRDGAISDVEVRSLVLKKEATRVSP